MIYTDFDVEPDVSYRRRPGLPRILAEIVLYYAALAVVAGGVAYTFARCLGIWPEP